VRLSWTVAPADLLAPDFWIMILHCSSWVVSHWGERMPMTPTVGAWHVDEQRGRDGRRDAFGLCRPDASTTLLSALVRWQREERTGSDASHTRLGVYDVSLCNLRSFCFLLGWAAEGAPKILAPGGCAWPMLPPSSALIIELELKLPY
jgi:hypothetical protein